MTDPTFDTQLHEQIAAIVETMFRDCTDIDVGMRSEIAADGIMCRVRAAHAHLMPKGQEHE